MKRPVMRFGAILGAATVTALAVAPAFAAAATSKSSAQSLQLSIAGNSAVSQKITATNDGASENRTDGSTVPTLADLLTGNNALGAGVAPQDARAHNDGTSFACAGIAGTGGGIAYVGNSECNIKGKPLTLNLGSLKLDLVNLLGSKGAITGPLGEALKPVTDQLGGALDDAIKQLTDGLATTPLGDISLAGGLSAVEASCTADPDKATGDSEILDTSGNKTIPITVTLPGGDDLILANVDVSMEPRPGGYDVLVDLDKVTAALFKAVEDEVDTAVKGYIAGLNQVLKPVLTLVQDKIVTELVKQLKDPLQQLSDNLLKLVVNDRTYGDGGRSVDVTSLRVEVLGAAKQYAGAALISGAIGHVTCGPNTRATAPNTPPVVSPPGGNNGDQPNVPTVVDSGVAGKADHTARNVLGATAALMLLAGTAGLVGYRRMLHK